LPSIEIHTGTLADDIDIDMGLLPKNFAKTLMLTVLEQLCAKAQYAHEYRDFG
jgi:hypothetical protein